MSLFDFSPWMRQTFPRSARQSRRAARRNKTQLLLLERLEDRLTPAPMTLFVANPGTYTDPAHPGNPQTGDAVTWNPGANTSFTGSVPGLTYGTNAFGTIQSAVTAAVSGDTIDVAAGTYAENVSVPTANITLDGAQYNANPVPGRSGSESIVEPGLTSRYDTSSLFLVTASNVTVEGFTIQGSIASPSGNQSAGFTLTSGTKVYAAAGVSNSSNINTGGSSPSTTDISGLTVENNIVQDFTQVGVYGDTSDGTVSTGNTISDNLITDIPENGQSGYDGEGVIIYDNFYADVTGNKITQARTGIQTGNNYLTAGMYAPSISNNTVSAYVKGVYFNLQYESATEFTVSDNTITQANATVSPAYNVGLLIQSIQSSVTADIQGNDVSGFLYGVEFAGNNTTNTVTVQGGTLNDNTYGVWDTNNDYFYPAAYATTAALDGVTITNSTTAGVWVDSTSPNSSGQFDTTDNTTLAVTDGTSISGNPVGLLVDGAHSLASLQQSTISSNTTGVKVETGGQLTSVTESFITGNTTGIAVASGAGTIGNIFDNDLAGNTTAIANSSGVLINASGNWWGVATSAGVRAAFTGLVDYTPFLVSGTDTDLITPGFQGDFSVLDVDALSQQSGMTGRIQEGINDVTAGGTVNVLVGTYAESVTIGQDLTLAGVSGSPTAAVIHPSSGDGITVSSPAATVTVENLEVTGANHGLNVSGVTTLNLTDLVLTGNTTGGTISDVTTVNETPSSGSTPTTVTVSGTSFVSDTNQAISLSSILNFIVFGSSGSDTFNVTPSSTTAFTIHGGLPTPPASPGDTLIVPSGGALTDTNNSTGYSGSWMFTGDAAVNFDGIETLEPTADLSVTQTVSPNPAAVNQDVTYTITVANYGPEAATNVILTDPLPMGTTFVSSTFMGYSAMMDQVNLGTIAANGSVTGTIVVVRSSEGTISNTATVASDLQDPNLGNNTSTLGPTYVVAATYSVADFPGQGVFLYADTGVAATTGWTHLAPPGISVDATALAINVNGDIAAEFPGYGVYRYLESTQTWTQLSTGYATATTIDVNDDVVGEFPDGMGALAAGVYRYTNAAGNFNELVSSAQASLLAGDDNGDVVGEFANGGPGGGPSGVYEFTFTGNTTATMTWLTSGASAQGAATQLAMDDNGDAFGAFSNGVYESVAPGATGSMNTQLSTGAATRLAADAAGDVIGYFPTGASNGGVADAGVYEAAAGSGVFSTTPLTTADPTLLAMGGDGDGFGEFPTYGFYESVPGGGGFTKQLTLPDTVLPPTLVTQDAAGDEFVALPNGGVWRYTTAAGWQEMSSGTATLLAVDTNGDAYAEFPDLGPTYSGVYEAAAGGQFLKQGFVSSGQATLLAVAGNGTALAEFPYVSAPGVYEAALGQPFLPQDRVSSGQATQLVVNANGTAFAEFPYVLNPGVYKAALGQSFTLNNLVSSGRATLLAVDAAGAAVGEFPDSGGVFETDANGYFTKQLPTSPAANAAQLAMDASGDVLAVLKNQSGVLSGVYDYKGTGTSWQPLTSMNASVVTNDEFGDVFVDFTGEGFYRFTFANGFQLVAGTQGDASVIG